MSSYSYKNLVSAVPRWGRRISAVFRFVMACFIFMMWETLPIIEYPWQNPDLLVSAH
jgi:hypothetical protein